MPFTSLRFIGFFAVLFFAYYAVPRRFQWLLLLAGSTVFYGAASPRHLLLLWTTILVTYAGARGMAALQARREAYLVANRGTLSREDKRAYKAGVERRSSWILTGTVVFLLALLGVFKYAQFAIDNVFALLGFFGVPTRGDILVDIVLPVGLSFYIFQSIGYCIDVHREEVPAERNLLKHALFVSYFPQLLQGPIGRCGRLAPQLLTAHGFDYEQAKFGLQRVAWGFFKKLVVANTIAGRINPCWSAAGDMTGAGCWWTILALYAVQLYADFSGYMDIACGCSQMLGIQLDENFNLPYFSRSVPEFWRRWHMTLSSWFKDYLFYPLLRSDWNARLRKRLSDSKYLAAVFPTSLALAIVWFATGLWHGANWGYVAWGVYYGVFMVANIALQPVSDRFHAALPKLTGSYAYALFQVVRTFAIVAVGYAVFYPEDLGVTMRIVRELVSCRMGSLTWLWEDLGAFDLLWVVALLAVDLVHLRFGENVLRRRLALCPLFVRWLVYLVGLLTVIFAGVYNSPELNQFAYFKF